MKEINITKERYGRLTLIKKAAPYKGGASKWLCLCDCGKTKIIAASSLKKGLTQSCGCIQKEMASKSNSIHGQSSYTSTIEYTAWIQMKDRCNNIKNHAYHNYGGRGIRVCDRWLYSFANFFEDMGKKPTKDHSLDRYPNKNGDYEKSNCRWATEKQQQSNRRNNHWLEYNGERKIFQEWANYFGVTPSAIHFHLKTKSFSQVAEYYEKRKIA